MLQGSLGDCLLTILDGNSLERGHLSLKDTLALQLGVLYREVILLYHSTLKRDRDGEFPEIEEALFRWIRQANAMKLAINGNILKEKAILLALKMGQDNFEASNDWLEKFKARRNIAFKRLHGEAGSVDANSVATWKGRGYHVVMDNFFTSVDLAKDLAGKQTYLTGTIQSNRRGYPKTLKRASLHVDEVIYMKSDMQLAAAYKEKAKRKSINFLSTYCDAVSETKPGSSRDPHHLYPQVKTVYDKYMGGVDLSDMMMYCYMDERKGRKHHRKVVINIIHRALLNSYILYSQHSRFVMDEAMEEVVEEEMNRCFEALKKHQAIDVNYIDFLEVDKDVQVAGEQSIEEIVKEKQFDEADSNKEGIATRKKHSRRSDRVRGEEFVKNVKEKIDDPGKSMRAIAKEMDVGSMTIVRTIHEDLGLKSYALRKGQLLTENMKNNRKGKAAALLNNLKQDSFGMLRFFSDEKNFDVDQKVNPKNDRWICKDPSEIPVVMHTKFPASVMVLGVISSEGDVMPPHFFEKGLRMNADTYINVLETVVKPWMDMVAAGRKYVFQQDSAPAHKAKKTQSWLTLNVPSHWGPDIWPPNSPDCNPLDYYVWGVVERDVNKASHTTIQSVKKAVHTVMTQMDKVIVAKACASFRTRLETVVANNGNYIE
ncbi:hypothetical protein LAZ67_22001238 [Cordylochernes scorpioides]|uniref:HTH CENPB-type domain-containing protein n=1 Tax=Cordylochernes scorpioides TaxID=51811 RepID=A0ABY6LNW6_9ARAC|nr:hypothetical protein LAZ67_22001238 [Cordylochernes scorpioides]